MFNELDLKQLWKELDEYNVELDKESKVLQEVWLKIANLKTKNEESLEKYVSSCYYSVIFFRPLLFID
jgi:hypothetical protein